MSTLAERRGIDVNLRSGPQLREYAAIADRIARDQPKDVLDWGCGWGQMTVLLQERGIDTTAYDYQPDHPAGTREMERYPGVPMDHGPDAVKLPYENGRFSAVLSCGVLEHVSDPGGSLDELHRIMRPQGRLYVYKLPNRFSYLEAIAKRAGLYYHGMEPFDEIYDKRSSTALLEGHGFAVTEFRRTNLLPLTVDHPLAARVSTPIWAANRALRLVPGLSFLATNVELIATRR